MGRPSRYHSSQVVRKETIHLVHEADQEIPSVILDGVQLLDQGQIQDEPKPIVCTFQQVSAAPGGFSTSVGDA